MIKMQRSPRTADAPKPLRVINSVAPVRICDNGGWTDTWFAEYGSIFNIAVIPYAEVQVEVFPYTGQLNRVVLFAENYGERFAVQPEALGWNRDPLLQACVERMGVPRDVTLSITVYSEVPAGASTGTSAAVTVALIGALDCLTPGRMTALEVARTAHAVETEMLGQQCGIQDQLCSALGGINYIQMDHYPNADVSPVPLTDEVAWELERRLLLVYLGRSHSSSAVHEKVIAELRDAGPDCARLQDLRATAAASRDALAAGDFAALGKAMVANTEAQGRLHSELVCDDALSVIEIAKAYGAIGWKVNGAGGDGGSMTILCGPQSHRKRALVREVEQELPLCRHIPVNLSATGVRVWDMPCP